MWIICIAHLELSPSNRNVSCNLANVRVSAWPTFCLSPFRSFVAIYGALCALYIIVLCCDNERTNKITTKKIHTYIVHPVHANTVCVAWYRVEVERTMDQFCRCTCIALPPRALPIIQFQNQTTASTFSTMNNNDGHSISRVEGGSWNQHQCFRFHRKMFSEIRQVLSGLVQARIKAPRRLVYCKRLSGPAPSIAKHTTEFDSLHKPNDLQWTGRRFIATFRHWRVYFFVRCCLYSALFLAPAWRQLRYAAHCKYIHIHSQADRQHRR